MNDPAVDAPRYEPRPPFDCVQMKRFSGIEAEIDAARTASISEAHRCPVVAWVEVDIDQHSASVIPCELKINLLPRGVSMQEKARHESGARSWADLCLEPPVQKVIRSDERSGTVRPAALAGFAQRQVDGSIGVGDGAWREPCQASRKGSWVTLSADTRRGCSDGECVASTKRRDCGR